MSDEAAFSVDDSAAQRALDGILLDPATLMQIEQAGAQVQIAGQRRRVPVKSGATQASIASHIERAGDSEIVDEIGPETPYAPSIELGNPAKPNQAITPFVRETELLDGLATVEAMQRKLGDEVKSKWPT